MVTSGAQNFGEKAEKFLKSVSLLSDLTDGQRASIAGVMEEKKYEDGEYIVSKGDIADALYFIKSGECVAHSASADLDPSTFRLPCRLLPSFGARRGCSPRSLLAALAVRHARCSPRSLFAALPLPAHPPVPAESVPSR